MEGSTGARRGEASILNIYPKFWGLEPMNLRQLLVPILGAWIGAIALLLVIELGSASMTSHILERPHEKAAKLFEALGSKATNQLVQYEAAELRIRQRDLWLRVEAVAGVVVFFGLLFATDAGTGALVLALVLAVVTLLQLFGLYPHLMGFTRAMAFDSRDVSLGKDLLFLHGVNMAVEGLKVVLAAGVILSIGSRRRRRKQFREEVHPINNADHSHVNR